MAKIVGQDTGITISDDIRFILDTTDGDDCAVSPYQITNATVYFVSREFTDSTAKEYERETLNSNLQSEYNLIKRQICLKRKEAVRVATTQGIQLTGPRTIDGVSVVSGDRVLVKNQTNSSENGIYVVTEERWARSNDANSSDNIVKGMYVFVENGIDNINTGWVLDCPEHISLGTTQLNFFRFSYSDNLADAPDGNSLEALNLLRRQIDESKSVSSFFYKNAVPIKTFGGYTDPDTGELFPAWLNPDLVPSDLKEKTIQDNIIQPYYENDEVVKGKFVLEWKPLECREGDYFICWSWMPNLAGKILSSHIFFMLEGDSRLNTSIPTHRTRPDKYEILMDRYLPEMFKTIISENDLTPTVLQEFNKSVARGFTFIEDMANQIIDLLDANATHEQLLPLLSNMFNLKLRSSDPTLWRRQIKKAIPNFKRKGTIEGLRNGLSDVGIKLLKITKLWQVVSKYTFQEHFVYSGSDEFELSKNIILPIDSNFRLWVRPGAQSEWQDITSDYESKISLTEDSLTWIDEPLEQGDQIRILYKFREIPPQEQSLEDYVQTLPLMDDRDERDQEYPPKNWNVRLVEEDDDLFDVLVPVRHPISDPIIWGRVRTEFPYSENAYAMDEYNGSKRDSFDPCDIDKEFVDGCGQCQSSKFTVDLEVERLSDDSLEEAKQTISDYMPFHSLVHSLNLSGAMNEFVRSSEERIEALVQFSKEDVLLAGEGQHIFNKDMDSEELASFKRDMLASFSAVPSSGNNLQWSGVVSNQRVVLSSSVLSSEQDLSNLDFKGKKQGFDSIGINTGDFDVDPRQSSNLLEILGESEYEFSVSSVGLNSMEIYGDVDSSVIGPLFEYRISNKIGDFTADIEQANRFVLTDVDADFWMLGVISQHDIEIGSLNSAWRLRHLNKQYVVQNVLPDGTLLLSEESVVTPVVGWFLYDGSGNLIKSSNSGSLSTIKLGLVDIGPEQGLAISDYVYIDDSKYKIKSLKNGEEGKFYIENYEEGDSYGQNVSIYRRILENKVGQFAYEGIKLTSSSNLAVSTSNADEIKENFLIFMDSKYYTILSVNSNELVLSGPLHNWTIDGENVNFMVYKFDKQSKQIKERIEPPVPAGYFERLDRSGAAIIKNIQDNALGAAVSMLSMSNSNEKTDLVNQNEHIDFNIEYKE